MQGVGIMDLYSRFGHASFKTLDHGFRFEILRWRGYV